MKLLAIVCVSIGLSLALIDRDAENKSSFDPNNYENNDVLRRDVAVIGGGATGTYGVIKLKDAGKSVVLVEKAAILGGHEDTYFDPVTGISVDYGVQAYLNISVVRDFFARFDIPIIDYLFEGGTTVYADFKTGEVLLGFTQGFNFSLYAAQLDKYPDLAWSWTLPSPVPEDLLIPFRDFVIKYSLQSVAYSVYAFCAGVSNVLDQLTVNIFKWFDKAYLVGIAGGNVATARRDNGELFRKALVELGHNALVSSTVIAAQRPANGKVKLVVNTPTGTKLIIASQILITIPPLLKNMDPFDLNSHEYDLFSKWSYSAYYTTLINNTGFPNGYSYINAGANTLYHIPNLPAVYSINPTRIDGLFYGWYGSATELTQSEVQSDITAVVGRLTNNTQAHPGFPAFSSHTPCKLVVDADAIANGFYKELYALQGKRNTWYTGAALLSHNSAGLWNFTQALLPSIVAAV